MTPTKMLKLKIRPNLGLFSPLMGDAIKPMQTAFGVEAYIMGQQSHAKLGLDH